MIGRAVVLATMVFLFVMLTAYAEASTPYERKAVMIGTPVDIARFAAVRRWTGPEISYPDDVRLQAEEYAPRVDGFWVISAPDANIGLEWGEPQDVRSVSFAFANAEDVPLLENCRLEVWLNRDEGDADRPRPLVGAESPSQGRWYALTSNRGLIEKREGDSLVYDLPKIRDGLFKIRLVIEEVHSARVREVHAYTSAKWREVEFEVHFDPPRDKPTNLIEGFAVEVLQVVPLAGEDGYRVKALVSDASSNSCGRAIFTIREGSRSFSFLMNDLDTDGVIVVKPFGVRVAKPGAVAPQVGETITERVVRMPEQTLDSALQAVPSKKRTKWLALAPPLNPKKFAVRPDGGAFSREEWDFVYQFATGEKPDYERNEPQHVEDDCLPVLYSDWDEDGLHWQQGWVVTSLGQLDDPTADTALITRISVDNKGVESKEARLWFCMQKGDDTCADVRLEQGIIWERDRLRGLLTADGWDVSVENGELKFTRTVSPGESLSLELEVPWPTVESPPSRITFEAARGQTVNYWKSKLAEGAEFIVPDERVNRIWKSLLIHQYCWGDFDEKSGYYLANVGAFAYGPVGNESSQMAKAVDFFGHSKLAQDYYEPMWKKQGARDLCARITNGKGALVGWWSGYVFNTGFILWNLGNHYRLTGDRAWLDKVLPNMIKACDWLAEQRRTTVASDPSGKPLMESGFFPPCGLEDESRWFYWVMTNGYFYLGMRTVADLLEEIEHPDAKRIADEADAYLRDLRRGIGESIVRCPVVKLRNGTYTPYVPKHLYRRGRSEGHYEAELGALHLLTTGVYSPRSPEMDWTLLFHEDVVYMTEAPSRDSILSYENIERDWFHLGGYGKTQPYLVHTQVSYLRRDEPKLFLRSFWNQLVAQNYWDINAFPEHICWHGAADCKTYEEAMWLQQFRYMLLLDEDGKLRLCVGTPREWLQDGKNISVKRAPTFYGDVSFEIWSETAHGQISAHVEFSGRKKPSAFTIRFRHPDNARIRSVEVNGKPWDRFDPASETIELPTDGGAYDVVARY